MLKGLPFSYFPHEEYIEIHYDDGTARYQHPETTRIYHIGPLLNSVSKHQHKAVTRDELLEFIDGASSDYRLLGNGDCVADIMGSKLIVTGRTLEHQLIKECLRKVALAVGIDPQAIRETQ